MSSSSWQQPGAVAHQLTVQQPMEPAVSTDCTRCCCGCLCVPCCCDCCMTAAMHVPLKPSIVHMLLHLQCLRKSQEFLARDAGQQQPAAALAVACRAWVLCMCCNE
jgi:hypothetical protein